MVSMVQFDTDNPQHGALGPAGMVAIDNFHQSDPSRGFIRGGAILESPANAPILNAFGVNATQSTGKIVWGEKLKNHIRSLKK